MAVDIVDIVVIVSGFRAESSHTEEVFWPQTVVGRGIRRYNLKHSVQPNYLCATTTIRYNRVF